MQEVKINELGYGDVKGGTGRSEELLPLQYTRADNYVHWHLLWSCMLCIIVDYSKSHCYSLFFSLSLSYMYLFCVEVSRV